jgi:hypothetical protein
LPGQQGPRQGGPRTGPAPRWNRSKLAPSASHQCNECSGGRDTGRWQPPPGRRRHLGGPMLTERVGLLLPAGEFLSFRPNPCARGLECRLPFDERSCSPSS